MSGIDKEEKKQDKKEIPSDIEELFSRHNTSIQEPYLSNMARLISAVMKCNNRDDWVFVNRYLISKNIISRDAVTYKNISDVLWVYSCILFLSINSITRKKHETPEERRMAENILDVLKC